MDTGAPTNVIPTATALVWSQANGPVANSGLRITPDTVQVGQNCLRVGPNHAVTIQDLTRPAAKATSPKARSRGEEPDAPPPGTGMQLSTPFITSATQLIAASEAYHPVSAPFTLEHTSAKQLRDEGNTNAIVVIVYVVGPDNRAVSVHSVWAYAVETTFFAKKDHAERLVDMVYEVATDLEVSLPEGGQIGSTQWKACISDNTARVSPWKTALLAAAERHRDPEIGYATRFDFLQDGIPRKLIAFLATTTTAAPDTVNADAAAWAVFLTSTASPADVYPLLKDSVDRDTPLDRIIHLVSEAGSVREVVNGDAVTSLRALEADPRDRRHVRQYIDTMAGGISDGVGQQQQTAEIAAQADRLRHEAEALASSANRAVQEDRAQVLDETFNAIKGLLKDTLPPEAMDAVTEAFAIARSCAGQMNNTIEGIRQSCKDLFTAVTAAVTASTVDTPMTELQMDALVEGTLAAICSDEPPSKRTRLDPSALADVLRKVVTPWVATLPADQTEWIKERPMIVRTNIRRAFTAANEIATRKAHKASASDTAFVAKQFEKRVQMLRRSQRTSAIASVQAAIDAHRGTRT